MKNYPEIKFGMHKGTRIDEIPMDYLIWLFPGLAYKKRNEPLYRDVLEYFLLRDVRVEITPDGIGKFFFNDYYNPLPGGGERQFVHTYWMLENSKGKTVYELGSAKFSVYIEKVGDKFEISNKYVRHTYKFRGLPMVYENNPNYYFHDGYGRIMKGAFLMRKPFVPTGHLAGEFSENLPIEKLNKQKTK